MENSAFRRSKYRKGITEKLIAGDNTSIYYGYTAELKL